MEHASDSHKSAPRSLRCSFVRWAVPIRCLIAALLLGLGLVLTACAREPLSAPLAQHISRGAPADAVVVRVTRVIDGDTVEVRNDATRTTTRVRLAGIDAPERAQPFATRARERLGELLRTQPVRLQVRKYDRYQRAVGNLWAGGVDAGLALIAEGLAWHFSRYAHEQPRLERAAYEAAQVRARADRVGLWREPEPVAPWDWRSRNRNRD